MAKSILKKSADRSLVILVLLALITPSAFLPWTSSEDGPGVENLNLTVFPTLPDSMESVKDFPLHRAWLALGK